MDNKSPNILRFDASFSLNAPLFVDIPSEESGSNQESFSSPKYSPGQPQYSPSFLSLQNKKRDLAEKNKAWSENSPGSVAMMFSIDGLNTHHADLPSSPLNVRSNRPKKTVTFDIPESCEKEHARSEIALDTPLSIEIPFDNLGLDQPSLAPPQDSPGNPQDSYSFLKRQEKKPEFTESYYQDIDMPLPPLKFSEHSPEQSLHYRKKLADKNKSVRK